MKRIAVVMGGTNHEREVSLMSAAGCLRALEELGYEAYPVDIQDSDWIAQLLQKRPDAIFNALHGKGVEDGKIQGVFEHINIPYTHSGVLASAIGMDKCVSKALFQARGIPVAPHRIALASDAAQTHLMSPPYVIKPLNQGSSVGVHIIRTNDDVPHFLTTDWVFGSHVLLERYIPGYELTCGILNDEPLGILDIQIPDNIFYNYSAKYTSGGSHHAQPTYLSPSLRRQVETMALMAHQALGCRGVTRSDFRLDPTQGEEGLFLLEINTQPGMTPTSLVPEMATHRGMSYNQLVDWMIQDASCHR